VSDSGGTTKAPFMSNNLVRDIHDVVASSKDLAEASIRPSGTTRRELRAMERDVLRKLQLERGTSVAEIGCGIGLLGLPVAERAARYVGLDFAPLAVAVATERLGAAGLSDRASVLCIDALSVAEEELDRLGRFDRVLMYAVLHYARNEQEAMRSWATFRSRTSASAGWQVNIHRAVCLDVCLPRAAGRSPLDLPCPSPSVGRLVGPLRRSSRPAVGDSSKPAVLDRSR
jgi:SAM-dependent methyltransferase